MNTKCHKYVRCMSWSGEPCIFHIKEQKRLQREARKVMIQMCCCLSCLELLNNSYKTLSFGKVIASGSFKLLNNNYISENPKNFWRTEGDVWQQAQKVMIQMCFCLSCLELLNNSYKTLSFRKVIASGSF